MPSVAVAGGDGITGPILDRVTTAGREASR